MKMQSEQTQCQMALTPGCRWLLYIVPRVSADGAQPGATNHRPSGAISADIFCRDLIGPRGGQVW